MSDRCEPPEELRGVDGWHWVQAPVGEPHLARWHAAERPDVEPLWTSTHHVYSGTPRYVVREWGWRYHSPVATSAEVEALRAHAKACSDAHNIMLDQRDAARAELATLRVRVKELEGAIKNAADAIERAHPDILTCTLWMPEDVSLNETVVDHLRAALGDAT